MKKIVLLSISSLIWSQSILADTNKSISASAEIGGLAGIGIGTTIKYKMDEKFGLRLGFNTLTLNDVTVEDDDLSYNFDTTVEDINLLLDWHPWSSSFRTTAGLMVNNSNLDGDLTPSKTRGDSVSFTFDGKDYNYKIDDLGAIHTTADFDPVAPYVGIGWDTSFEKDKGFGFVFNLGVAYTGSAKIDYSLKYGDALDIDKAVKDIPDSKLKQEKIEEIKRKREEIEKELKKELDKKKISLQDELDKYKIVPYISIGFNYKF